ncbi:hypothetical protein WJX74_002922 [Apatococcus lobatus]|uniref:Ribosomal protein L27 n=1 Tax=Apatococcus lobatus TaxID=904363 RepID=A0AAW1RYA0_9CHLO
MSLTSAFTGLSLHTCGATRSSLNGTKLSTRPALRLPAPCCPVIEAAHKKGGGSTKNGRDSVSKRRGVKVWGGQPVKAGGIIVRQLGTQVHPGPGVARGNDYTLFALSAGIVTFKKNKYIKQVSVVPFDQYVVPEGCQVKKGSRSERNRAKYTSRHLQEGSPVLAGEGADPVDV